MEPNLASDAIDCTLLHGFGADLRAKVFEDRYQALGRATGSMVFAIGPTGTVSEMPDWSVVTGQSPEESQQGGWLEMIHPADRERTLNVWSAAVQRQEPYSTEYRLKMADGTHRWYRARAVPVLNDNGTTREWVGLCEDIHERATADEERNRFFSVGVDMMAVIGFDGYFKQVSPRWTMVLGWTEEELLSHHLDFFTHPEDRQRTYVERAIVLQGFERQSFENRYLAKDGTYRWISWTALPFTGEKVIYASATDVTKRRASEEALRLSEERFRLTFDNAAVGIAHVSLEGRWLQINQALCKIVGYSAEELKNKTFGDITHPDDLEEDWRNARKLAVGEIDTYTIEKRYVQKDRSSKWVNLTVSLMRDSDGAPKNFISVIEDISARKEVEQALLESEDHYRFMIATNPQMPWTADPLGNMTDFSARWLEMTNLTREQAQGMGWQQVLHPEDMPRMTDAWLHSVATGEVYDIEHRARTADGSYRWMRARAVPRKDSAGKTIRWYGSTEDIDKQKHVEANLERLVEERTAALNEANSALTVASDWSEIG